jgi:hypothetical protein
MRHDRIATKALHDALAQATAQQGAGAWDEAAASYGQALSLDPENADIANNLGVALWSLDRLDEAATAFGRAIHLRADFAEAQNNLGTALRDSGRPQEAEACFRTAVALRPDYALAHNNLGMALLARGEFAPGWAEYEWRWQIPGWRKPGERFGRPQWQGEAAPGRKLLIHSEQGLGDALQFCRYGPLAAERGMEVTLVVPPALVRLLRTLPGVTSVLAPEDGMPAFDLVCPMLSLPLAFGTTLGTIPAETPYLQAGAADTAAWSMRLDAMAGPRLRVGVAWAGNARLAADRRRSLSPGYLAGLARIEGVQLVSLQKGGPAPPSGLKMIDWMHLVGDFADTAALIANLDLVIAIDSAPAHLAAAMGKPVWLLDRFDSCWRWLSERTDSPWYPTLRLYRQTQPGDWDGVLARVVRDLHHLAGPVVRAGRLLAKPTGSAATSTRR